jgi:hypothetical protein
MFSLLLILLVLLWFFLDSKKDNFSFTTNVDNNLVKKINIVQKIYNDM